MAPISEIFWFLVDPWLFMAQALYHLPPTIIHLLRNGNLDTLLHPSKLQDAWFSTFWAGAGPGVRENAEARVVPLLEGAIANGSVVAPTKGNKKGGLSGTVIEVGPGTGNWVSVFAKVDPGCSSRTSNGTRGRGDITRIYGVEPNPDVHAGLRQSIVAAGLQDVYEIVPLGIEDLAASGRVERESVDCIVSILCLCGIPDPAFNIKEMYGYLKPGGRWFVYEHVKCGSQRTRDCGLFMKVYQRFVNLLWPHLIGGCQLCRDTPKMLLEAGPWTKIDLAQTAGEPWYHPLPHVVGTLTK